MRTYMKNKWMKWMYRAIFILGCIFITGEPVHVQAGVYDSPFVTFSPDGNAFTTNAEDRNYVWYEEGYCIDTGEVSSLKTPAAGEHVYTYINNGEAVVGKWIVEHKKGRCIHNAYPTEAFYYGVPFGTHKCFGNYYSGWRPYCVDCGELIGENLFYMSEQAAASIQRLDMSLAYYYRCPWCTNLEQGKELGQHVCKKISANQYSVRYHANYGRGYMPKSIHMYGNASVYEGQEVTPQRNLHLNSYTRPGYEFTGWNTQIDGTGQHFEDGQEIYNLCAEEQGSVVLYAQWKKSSSVLEIDPGEGTFRGMESICRIRGTYGSSYQMEWNEVQAPEGAKVHFNTMGGMEIPDMVGTMEYTHWSFQEPLNGTVEESTYYYTGKDQSVDRALILYEPRPIVLPQAYREGYSFGGWYYEEECKRAAGTAGDSFLPGEDITLYACWVDLKLDARDNYGANGGKGAVDLAWSQADAQEKRYLVYQKKEGTEWEKIHSAEDISGKKTIRKNIPYTGKEEIFTVPFSGYYRLTLFGAQGENYGNFQGGKGGMTAAVIYLHQGDVLLCKVGGQNGWNGGGTGEPYGNGGGYTCVTERKHGLLLAAGGGGGASAVGNGQAGGAALYTIDGNVGGNGTAGGGGGYRGGAGGVASLHNHIASCQHIHSGTPGKGGGCYTKLSVCGSSSFTEEAYKEIFYYGNIDDNGNSVFCVRCGSDDCPGHRDTFYRYRCKVCGTVYDRAQARCNGGKKYSLGCGLGTYICGYTQGQVLSSKPAYGGSGFIKEEICFEYEKIPGVNVGDGSILIEAVSIGYLEKNELAGVKAGDCGAPEEIQKNSVKILPVDENKVNIYFHRPADRGTIYYHKAESYDKKTNQRISISNITSNELISGVSGYRYCTNNKQNYDVTEADVWYGSSHEHPYIGINLEEGKRYLHIAAQDKAGNLSGTTHVSIAPEDITFWPILTEPIHVAEGDTVYKKDTAEGETVYYVKADGTSPFHVSFDARICGTAGSKYQINQMHFLSQAESEGALKVLVPMRSSLSAGSYTYDNKELGKRYEGNFCLKDASYTQVRRRDYCRELQLTQGFALEPEMDEQMIRLTPEAAVMSGGVKVMSEHSMDLENSVLLLADGKAPRITGLEIPGNLREHHAAKWNFTMEVNASDTGSGLKSFCLEIHNQENGGYELLEDIDGDGSITLEISSEKTIYLGHFSVAAKAVDNVGNRESVVCGMEGLAVNAVIEKIREPGNRVFKKGESGILRFSAFGYADRVEVIFPETWCREEPGLNRIFQYHTPDYMQQEEISFMVPMNISEGSVAVQVRAYRGDSMAEVSPELLTVTVEGSILDEIRTRLR